MFSELPKGMNLFLSLLVFFFVTELSAQGWVQIASGTTNSLNSIHFADNNTGYAVGEAGTILKSTDGGLNWQDVSVPSSTTWYDVFVFDQYNVVASGSGGAIFRTTDGGGNWTTVTSGVVDELLSVSFSGSNGIIGASSQTILYSTDIGASWSISQSGFFGGGFQGTFMLSSQTGFVAGVNSIFQPLFGKSTNSGVNWDFTAFYLNSNEGGATGVDFTDENTGYVSAYVWDGTGAISKTTNSGADWVTTMFANPLWDIDFPISGASLVGYSVGASGTILKTTNAGSNWQSQQSGTSQTLNGVYFLDLDFGFAVGDGGIILRTVDGGVPVELVSFSADVDGHNVNLNWITATETNNQGFEIQRSEVSNHPPLAEEWEKIGFVSGFGTTTEPKSYSFIDKNINAGLYAYRLKQIDFDGTYEYSNIVQAEVFAANEFSLSQNYPNPFNPSTKIKFSVPLESQVKLDVFNVTGQKVAQLINSKMSAGIHEINFDASGFSSGVYFYQLKAGSFIETRKMILSK